MKRLLIILGVVVGIVVVAIGAARLLVDWDRVRAQLLVRAGQAVGLLISFDGEIELKFLPRPALRIEGLRIGPAGSQGDGTIVAAEAVEIAPSLLGLLGGRVDIEAIALSGVSVALERDASGRGNWQALLDAIPEGDGSNAGVTTEIRVARGTVFFHDRATGRQETIGSVAGRATVPGEIGSYALDLAFVWHGVALSLTATAAQPDADGKAPFDLALRDADLGTLTVSGRANLATGRVEQGRVRADSSNAGKLLARFGRAGSWPPSLRQLRLDGRLAANADGFTLDDLRLRLGDVTASGGVLTRFGATPRIDIALNLPQLALDPLITAIQPPAGRKGGGGGPIEWPNDIAAHLTLEIGAATYRGSAVRSVKLDAALAGGKVAIERFEGTAPGGTEIKVTGRLGSDAGGLRLDGKLASRSDDLRAFLGWLGADLAEIAASRLRRAEATAALIVDARGLVLDQSQIEVDSSTATGRIAVPWADGADIDLAVEIDRLDLDAYRTASAPAAPPAKGKSAARGVTGHVAVGSLTLDSRALHDVKLDGRWNRDRAEIRSFAAEAPGAALVRGSGTVDQPDRAPVFNGRIELQSREPGALVRWLGFQPSPGLSALDELTIGANLTASAGRVAATGIEAALGPTRFAGSASVNLIDGRPHIAADLKVGSWQVPWTDDEAAAIAGASAEPAARPVDFRWLTGFDADIRISAEELHARRYTLTEARAVAKVRENSIELVRLTARAYDGWLRAKGRLEANGERTSYVASVEAGDLAIEPLLVDAVEFAELAGKLHLAVEVKGAGSTDVELIRSADGTARVVATDGRMRGFDLARIAKQVASIENIGDIGDLMAAAEAGGETHFSVIQGHLSIVSGVARSEDLELRMDGGSGRANGWVDVAAMTVNLRGEVSIDPAPGKPTIGFVLRGPLDEPEREIKTGELRSYIQKRINDAGIGKARPVPAEAEIEAAVPHTVELPKPPRRFRKGAEQTR